MTAFGIAVGCTFLVCYALMARSQNSRRNRRSSGDNLSDSGNYAVGDSWRPAGFSGHHFGSLPPMARAIRSIPADAIAEEAAIAVAVAAISEPRKSTAILIYRNSDS